MSRDWRSYPADIRTACEKVAEFTAGMDRKAFSTTTGRTTPSSTAC